MRFLRVTYIWILALPFAVTFLGAASNQLVLIANHDTFPVMVNPISLQSHGGVNATFGNTAMMDDVHCVMTKDTHLNFLADIFDLKDAIYSVGDFLLMLGEWLSTFCPFVWVAFVVRRILEASAAA